MKPRAKKPRVSKTKAKVKDEISDAEEEEEDVKPNPKARKPRASKVKATVKDEVDSEEDAKPQVS